MELRGIGLFVFLFKRGGGAGARMVRILGKGKGIKQREAGEE
jgi:hypothetical protein